MTAEENCVEQALVIDVAKVANRPNYKVYRAEGEKILPKVREFLKVAGFDFSRGGGVRELEDFQHNFSEFRI